MKPISLLLIVFYFTDLIFDSVLGKLGTVPERYLTKGLFMPLLFTFFIIKIKNKATESNLKYIRLICLGLALSFISDLIFVNKTQKLNFAAGLGVWALVYTFYFWFLYKKKPFLQKNEIALFITTLIVTGYFVIINYVFWGKMYLQNMIFPVILYSLAAALLLLCAVNITLSKSLNKVAITFFIPATVCLVASGSMLGFNRFELSKPLADYYITGTYCIGQFLFVSGSIQIISNKKSR